MGFGDNNTSRPKSDTPKQRWVKFVLGGLLIGLALGGPTGFVLGQRYRGGRSRPDPGPAYVKLAEWSPRKGPAHAKVTIVEFSDFQ